MSELSQQPNEFRFDIQAEDMNVTEAAHEQLVSLFGQVDDDDIEAIRIYVSGGGCAGMTYGMTFTDRRTPFDMVLDRGDVKIYVDSVAMQYLRGVEIDYVDKPMGASFVFNNVFASTGGSGMCGGCGAAAH